MVMHGRVWSFVAMYGHLWSFLVKYAKVSLCLVMYGHCHAWSIWSYMVMHGPYMVMYDLGLVMYRHCHVWSCMALYDCVRSCKVQSRKYRENIE